MFFPVRRPPFGFIALVVVLTLIPLVTDAGTHAKKLPKCCVWRVTNATAPFYLVGSIHALGKKDYPLPKPYEIALKDSNRFVFEFDPTRHTEFEKKFEAAAKYPRGQDIRSKVSPELLAWLCKNMFTMVPNGRAGSRDRMGGLSDRDGEFMLQDALTQPDSAEEEFTKMYKAWRKGDTNALWAGDAHLRTKAPKIAARFVDDRNVKWVPRIEAELKTGKPTAIVAGALHFSGPHSVIALLQQRGYVIEQL